MHYEVNKVNQTGPVHYIWLNRNGKFYYRRELHINLLSIRLTNHDLPLIFRYLLLCNCLATFQRLSD